MKRLLLITIAAMGFLASIFVVAEARDEPDEWIPSGCGDEWVGADGEWHEKQYRPEECR